MASKMYATRLSLDTIGLIQNYAKMHDKSQSEAVTSLIGDALDMKGRDGLESRLAAAEAKIAEQERLVRKATGRPTPKTKRMSLGMSLAEYAAVDKAARAAGQTRGEFLRERVFGAGGPAAARPMPAVQERPALPAR